MICEAVTLPPRYQLPYHFEVRQHEMIEFIFRSEFPLDAHFASMLDYDAWVNRGCGPAKPLSVYTEALGTVGHAMEFVAPDDGSYVAVLLNNNANAVDVAVEIRFSPATHGRARKLSFECWDGGVWSSVKDLGEAASKPIWMSIDDTR